MYAKPPSDNPTCSGFSALKFGASAPMPTPRLTSVIASSDAPASVKVHTTALASRIRFANAVRSSDRIVSGAEYTSTFTKRNERYEIGALWMIQNAFPSADTDGYAKRRQIAAMTKPDMPRFA